MGEIADMMLEGDLCECCGGYLPGQGQGFPRRCQGCQPTKAERKAENIARHEALIAQQKKAPCPTCGKRVRIVGMADHQRDAHGSQP
ncbi:hypothetical protein OCJ37_14490 [Xanthomonas sp. AM6]|uniref:hypothetical protein n=1 Tax=Xanthomonas sp. AM6 TaxID=2982531 RepID=UPI0021DB2B90|nr:hypothetical protein [Xanthomonas sp. AM6]UYB51194.1 hypothetical protein OCJ37_14490 [Xanthomonas sp. AM6]